MHKLFLLTFFLTACASPSINPNLFLSPEARGKTLSGNIQFGLTDVAEVEVYDEQSTSLQYSEPNISAGLDIYSGGELGIWENYDFFLNSSNGGATLSGIKIQLLGQTANVAKTGNFSLSIAGALAFGSASAHPEATRETTFVKYSGHHFLLLFGYRPMDSLILYINPFWAQINVDVDVVTSNEIIYPDGKGYSYGSTLGTRSSVGPHIFVAAEASLAQTSWTRTRPTHSTSQRLNILPATVVGFNW